MPAIKLTAKRQATFPMEVCKELGVTSGDTLELHPLRYNNQKLWVLKPAPKSKSSWIGSLSKYVTKTGKPWTRAEQGDLAGRALAEESGK